MRTLYGSFHRLVKEGVYDIEWGSVEKMDFKGIEREGAGQVAMIGHGCTQHVLWWAVPTLPGCTPLTVMTATMNDDAMTVEGTGCSV